MSYINKDATLAEIANKAKAELADVNHYFLEGVQLAVDVVEGMPEVQPERKRGKWEMLQMPISPPVYKCSVCGSHALQSMTGCLMNRHYEANLTNYCPNCGADMRGE